MTSRSYDRVTAPACASPLAPGHPAHDGIRLGRLRVVDALRRPPIRALWMGLVLSAIGDTLYSIAIVWIAMEAVGSAAGVVAAAQGAATLSLAPIGGVLADRIDRRRTMIAADLLRGIVVATLPIAAAFGPLRLPHLIFVAVALGALTALFTPALQASVPSLVDGEEELHGANALFDTTFRIARAIGPSLAGLLAATISIPHFFTLDAVSFLLSAFAVSSLSRAIGPADDPKTGRGAPIPGPRAVLRELAGAVGLAREHHALSWALAALLVINATWSCAFTVGAALFAERVLGSDVGAYGLLVGAYGAGNVASSLVLGNLAPGSRTRTLFLGHMILGVGFMLFSAAPTLPLAMAATALAAIGGPLGSISMISMIQTELPRSQIGKVFSLRMCAEHGGSALGLLAAAPLFAGLPVRVGIALSGAIMLGVGWSGRRRFPS